jgi:hypothetical protein
MMTETCENVDHEIAAAWPDKWARANNPALRSRSKARNNLRKSWRGHKEWLAFKAANPTAACANCRYNTPMPNDGRSTCDVGSDFHGYSMIRDVSSVCTEHKARDND